MLILQRYCIIFGAGAQPEHLCGCYFCTQFYIFYKTEVIS
nr:MAG TPA: hypothetical protein [Caudoviricetes sp.]